MANIVKDRVNFYENTVKNMGNEKIHGITTINAHEEFLRFKEPDQECK